MRALFYYVIKSPEVSENRKGDAHTNQIILQRHACCFPQPFRMKKKKLKKGVHISAQTNLGNLMKFSIAIHLKKKSRVGSTPKYIGKGGQSSCM